MTCPVCGEVPFYTVMGLCVHTCGGMVFRGTPKEWQAHCESLEQHIDASDLAIANERIRSVEKDPSKLIHGEELERRLKALR